MNWVEVRVRYLCVCVLLYDPDMYWQRHATWWNYGGEVCVLTKMASVHTQADVDTLEDVHHLPHLNDACLHDHTQTERLISG